LLLSFHHQTAGGRHDQLPAINPGWLGPIRDKLGGDWVATGESYTQENKFTIAWLNRIFPHYYQNQSNQKYNLIMYRRVPVPPQHP
jgi:hypothetical protein